MGVAAAPDSPAVVAVVDGVGAGCVLALGDASLDCAGAVLVELRT